MCDKTIQHNDLLIAEYNNICQIMYQADESSAKVSEFFLLGFGSFIAAFLANDLGSSDTELTKILRLIVIILMGFLTIYGGVTVHQLKRLRRAWVDAVFAQTKIKTYFFKNNDHNKISDAFYYKDNNKPTFYNSKSVGTTKASMIAIMSGISFSAALYLLLNSDWQCKVAWLWVLLLIVTGSITGTFFYFIYQKPLEKFQKELKITLREQVENEFEELLDLIEKDSKKDEYLEDLLDEISKKKKKHLKDDKDKKGKKNKKKHKDKDD